MTSLLSTSKSLIHELAIYSPLLKYDYPPEFSLRRSAGRNDKDSSTKQVPVTFDLIDADSNAPELDLQDVLYDYLADAIKHFHVRKTREDEDVDTEMKLTKQIASFQTALDTINARVRDRQHAIRPILAELRAKSSVSKAKEVLSQTRSTRLKALEEELENCKIRKDTLKGVVRGLILAAYPNWIENPELESIISLCGDEDEDYSRDPTGSQISLR